MLILSISSDKIGPVLIAVVSSAKRKVFNVVQLGKSLIYIRNKTGPSTVDFPGWLIYLNFAGWRDDLIYPPPAFCSIDSY
jgi:hypothetical protein